MSTIPAALNAVPDTTVGIDNREVEAVRQILFFDGVCGLCNWSVDFVLIRDRRGLFQFAPLQGETARTLLSATDATDLNTVVLWVNGRSYRKSSAVVRVLSRLDFCWQVVGWLIWLIPMPLRNLGYSLVARYRYRLFGKKETCRLPAADERLRFLP